MSERLINIVARDPPPSCRATFMGVGRMWLYHGGQQGRLRLRPSGQHELSCDGGSQAVFTPEG